MPSTSTERVAAARRQVLEAEAACAHALAAARNALSEMEEENQELRREALKRDTVFYTEAEFAALLKVSDSTIQRERKRGKLQPLLVGSQYRYTSEHIAQAHEIFAPKRSARARGRGILREAS